MPLLRHLRRRQRKRAAERVPGLIASLESVVWSELEHAYGPATDVPDLVLGLLATDDREESLGQLFATVWHQGTVYAASAPAATALAIVVARSDAPGRGDVVALLSAFATGSGYVQVHRRFLEDTADDRGELDLAEQREAEEVRAARQAVVDALDELRPLVAADPDVEVRRALPQLLATCHDTHAVSLLRERLREEPDAAVRASIVLALGALGETGLPDGPEPIVRLAAAVAAADGARVADALDGMEAFDALGAWHEGEPERFVMERLAPTERLPVLERLLTRAAAEERRMGIHAAVELAMAWRGPTPAVVDLLTAALSDEAELAEAAAGALHALVPVSAPAADALLALRTPTALRALARLEDPRVVPLVVAELAAPDPHPWATEALERAGGSAVETRDRVVALLPLLPPSGWGEHGLDNRLPQCVRWLGGLGPEGAPAVPAILAVLRGGKADVAALLALESLGAVAAEALAELRGLLTADDEYVRVRAAVAIQAVSGDRQPLNDITDALLATPTRGALPLALDHLEEFPAERLLPLLEHPDEWVRLPAADALWGLTGDPEAVAETLLEIAGPTPAGERALAVLTQLPGDPAAARREDLELWSAGEERLVEAAGRDEVVERDERLRALATALLELGEHA